MYATETSIYLSALIASITIGVILVYFAFIIIRMQRHHYKIQQKELSSEIELLQKERKRIASDLHDELGPMLNLIYRQVEVMTPFNNKQSALYEKTTTNLKLAISKLGSIARDLNDLKLIDQGLEISIRNFIEQQSFGKKHHFEFYYQAPKQLPNTVTIHVYRMIQELINNTLRHAKATLITIKLREYDKKLYIYYSDNGVGFSQDTEKTGLGIKNLQHRTLQLGGLLKIESNNKASFFFEIPLYDYVQNSNIQN